MALNTNRTNTDFTFRHTGQTDKLGQSLGGNISTVQSLLDSRAEDNLVDINNIKSTLKSVTIGDSGAKNVSVSPIVGSSAVTVQGVLEETVIQGTNFTGTWQGYSPVASDPGIQSVVNDHTAQLADIAINVKSLGATGMGIIDETTFINSAIALVTATGGKVLIPAGTYLISSTIIIPRNVIFEGVGFGSVIKLNADVDGFLLNDSFSQIKNIKIISESDTYSKSLIKITTLIGSHAWDRLIENVYLKGGNTIPRGTGIYYEANEKGIMASYVTGIHFFMVESGIKWSIIGTNGFINGGAVRNTWADYTKYTFNFEADSMSRWLFDSCKAQFNIGYSEYHFYNVRGSGHRITQCLQWDGGKYLISTNSSNLYIDSQSTTGTVTGVEDYGYRTFIESVPIAIGGNTGQGWVNIIDNFIGYYPNPMWKSVLTNGTVSQVLNTMVPYAQGMLLSTGATASSQAKVDHGQNYAFNKFSSHLVSAYFKINSVDTTNIQAKIGLTHNNEASQAIVLVSPVYPNFMFKIDSAFIDTGIPKDLLWHSFQISRVGQSRLDLFFDRVLVSTLLTGVPQFDMEIMFESKNLASATDEKLFVTNLYARVGYRLTN